MQTRLIATFFGALLALGAVVGVGSAAAQESFDEGIDYTRVTKPERAEPGDGVEVLELFWYGCPHCYALEPDLKKWLAGKPEGVVFRQMPAAAAPRWVPHAKAYYAAEQLGVLDKLHEPLFQALHVQGRKVLTDEQLIDFAAEQGIDKAAFAAAYNSFPVDMQVRKAADLVNNYGIDGVPAIVVNGKYVTSATQTGGREKMFAVIDYLVAKERAAPASAQPAAAPAPAGSGGS